MTTNPLLCPWWARFYMRPDGEWIAYCSKEASEADPRLQGESDFERAEKCVLGFPELAARFAPAVIVSGLTNSNGSGLFHLGYYEAFRVSGLKTIVSPADMTDPLWEHYCQVFETVSFR